MRLSQHEIREYTDRCENLPPGGTTRFNHRGCASSTSSRSLAVTRGAGGALVVYCHKCGGSGAAGGDYRPGLEQESVGKRERLKPDWQYRVSDWPVTVKGWLNKSRVPVQELESLGVRYDAANEVLQFTIWSEAGGVRTPAGRFNRAFGKGWDGPKYLSFGQRSWLRRTDGGTVVVVEDYLSCAQCCLAGCGSLFLGGTRLSGDSLSALLESHKASPIDEVIILLDNDNEEVRRLQRELYTTLSLYFTTRVIRSDTDPKGLEIDELKELVR